MDILKVKQNGNWVPIPAIIGPRGIGITSITKTGTSGLTDTYTITFTNSSTTTFQVQNGAVPNLTLGTVTEGAQASATITGTAEAPVLNLVLPAANVTGKADKVANAVNGNFAALDSNGNLTDSGHSHSDYLTQETDPTVPSWAKAAQKPTYTAAEVGAPTVAEMNQAIAAINTMNVHICTAQEYNSETGIPTIQNPDTSTFYLVPGGESNNLYIEWVYVNSAWERFGSADVDLSGYALKSDTVLETTLSKGRKTNTTVGSGSIAFGNLVEASGNYSQAIGSGATASGSAAHAEGLATTASGIAAHAEGWIADATGDYSHAEGRNTTASGEYSHAEGHNTTASNNHTHAEGNGTEASGLTAHAEGSGSKAQGSYSHAEGRNTIANGEASHVSGAYNVEDTYAAWPEWVASTTYAVGDKVKVTTTANNETTVKGYICKTANSDASFTASNWITDTAMNYAEIVGNGTDFAARSNARALDWSGNEYLAGDLYVHANSNSTGGDKVLVAVDVPVESGTGIGSIQGKHYSSYQPVASGEGAFAVGLDTVASGKGSFAQGAYSYAIGDYSHAEGSRSYAIGIRSHAEGTSTYALGIASHAGGIAAANNIFMITDTANNQEYEITTTNTLFNNDSLLPYLHGLITVDKINFAIINQVEVLGERHFKVTLSETIGSGYNNTRCSIYFSYTNGTAAYTHGYNLIADANYQFVQGKHNTIDSNGLYAHIVGNGANVDTRSNAYALDWSGNGHFMGDVYVGANADSSGGNKLATTNIVAISDTQPTAADNKVWIRETASTSVQVPTVTEMETALAGKVGDVQVAGTSVVTNGVAAIPVADITTFGVIKVNAAYGIYGAVSGTTLALNAANSTKVKQGNDSYMPITCSNQHYAAFYGLSKAAGVDLANETVTFGTYPSAAKTAIKNMIGVQEGLEVVRLI